MTYLDVVESTHVVGTYFLFKPRQKFLVSSVVKIMQKLAGVG